MIIYKEEYIENKKGKLLYKAFLLFRCSVFPCDVMEPGPYYYYYKPLNY